MELKITKRQGEIEDWSDDKILTSIMRAGASSEESQKVSLSVKQWAAQNAEDGKISSTNLRDQVIHQLALVNPIAANTYQFYKK